MWCSPVVLVVTRHWSYCIWDILKSWRLEVLKYCHVQLTSFNNYQLFFAGRLGDHMCFLTKSRQETLLNWELSKPWIASGWLLLALVGTTTVVLHGSWLWLQCQAKTNDYITDHYSDSVSYIVIVYYIVHRVTGDWRWVIESDRDTRCSKSCQGAKVDEPAIALSHMVAPQPFTPHLLSHLQKRYFQTQSCTALVWHSYWATDCS